MKQPDDRVMNSVSVMHTKVRNVLKHHKLTDVGDAVVEADLIYAVLGALHLTERKKHMHGREFFQGEGQEIDNAQVDGWNACLLAIQANYLNNYQILLKI